MPVRMWKYISRRDHRLMRRVHRWRPPRWIRLWMVCATRGGDGWLWCLLGLVVLLYAGPGGAGGAGGRGSRHRRLASRCSSGSSARRGRRRPCAIEPHCWAKVLPPDRFSFPSGSLDYGLCRDAADRPVLSAPDGRAAFLRVERGHVSHPPRLALPQRRRRRVGHRLDARLRRLPFVQLTGARYGGWTFFLAGLLAGLVVGALAAALFFRSTPQLAADRRARWRRPDWPRPNRRRPDSERPFRRWPIRRCAPARALSWRPRKPRWRPSARRSTGDLAQRQTAVEGVVQPLATALEKLEGQVRDLDRARLDAFGALRNELQRLAQETGRSRQRAARLRRPAAGGARSRCAGWRSWPGWSSTATSRNRKPGRPRKGASGRTWSSGCPEVARWRWTPRCLSRRIWRPLRLRTTSAAARR